VVKIHAERMQDLIELYEELSYMVNNNVKLSEDDVLTLMLIIEGIKEDNHRDV
jgi:hypothetical protein